MDENKKQDIILSVKNLSVSFKSHGKDLKVIRGISLDIKRGETFAIVGESGSGKSVFTKTFTGMLEKNGKIKSGYVKLNGVEVHDPRIVKLNFKDENNLQKRLNKMKASSASGKAKKELLALEAKQKAELDKFESLKEASSVDAQFEKSKKHIDSVINAKIEKLDIKYAYVFNKFYSELSKIEMKKQNSIDKRGKKISIIFSNRKEYSPDSIAHLIEWTNNYQVSIQPKIDELKSEVAGLYSIDHSVTKEEIHNKYTLKSKDLIKLSNIKSVEAIKDLRAKFNEVLKTQESHSESRDLYASVYPLFLNALISEVSPYYDSLKAETKADMRIASQKKADELAALERQRQSLYENLKKDLSSKIAPMSDEEYQSKLEELKAKNEKELADLNEKLKNEVVKAKENNKDLIDSCSVFTNEEKEKYADYSSKDIIALKKRSERVSKLEQEKASIIANLKEIQTSLLKKFEEGNMPTLKEVESLGVAISPLYKKLSRLVKDKENLIKEKEHSLKSFGSDEKEQVRKQLALNEYDAKISHLEVDISSCKKDIVKAIETADFNFSEKVRKINVKIHQETNMASGWSRFKRTVSSIKRDEAIKLINSGVIVGDSVNLAKFKTNKQWSMIRGSHIATIFQDPMTSLNPLLSIGSQISEVLRIHHNLSRAEAKKEAISLLEKVRIPNAAQRYKDYPFQYSGGMRQRVVIAIALACRPDILICDEPTTALDVTVQAQILALIKELQKEYGFTTIFITHDLGVVAGVADRIGVMYGGQIVEYGTDEDIFYRAAHPYTWALLSSLPQLAVEGEPLTYIRGNPPAFDQEIDGDAFAPRSEYAMKIDYIMEPPMTQISETHYAKTWLLDKRAPKVKKPAVIRNLEERMKKTAESFLASSNGGESHE